jgi:hypothetical protein
MDVRHLEFEDHSFDVAIDKGTDTSMSVHVIYSTHTGTMDAMMTSKGDVWVC